MLKSYMLSVNTLQMAVPYAGNTCEMILAVQNASFAAG